MHTQGKWIARINEYAVDVIEEKSGFGIADIGTRKSLKDANYPNEQADANARLIAAAPDLLDACRIALHTLDCIDVTRRPGTASNKLQAAIDKALGL